MKIKPVFTEKSMQQAKKGLYSFWVLPEFSKDQVKDFLEKAFEVKIGQVKSINYKKSKTRNFRGKMISKKALKKVMVTLKSGKLEMFEETKGK